MSTRAVLLFTAAVGILFLAHVVRAARHSLLFAKGELPARFDLLLALSLSYALNTLVPLRVGEVVRVLFIAVRLRLRVSYVAATVVAERLSDMVVVAAISAALAAGAAEASPGVLAAALVLAGVALALVAAAVLVQSVAAVRRVVWHVASIFNESIRLGILDFVWTVSQLVTRGPLLTGRFLATTAGMWALYLTAFGLFAAAAGLSLAQVSFALLGAPLKSLLYEFFSGGVSRGSLALLAFTVVPIVAVLCYGLVRERRDIARSLAFVRRFGLAPAELSHPPMSRRFRNTSDHGLFLLAQFGGTNQIISAFAAEGMDDVVVHRLLPGGSEAVTAVVEVGGSLTIRKLAAAGAGRKLGVQAAWLREHADSLPLAEVVAERRHPDMFHYEMPYRITARDFYDVIHTTPLEASCRILREVVEEVAAFHREHARGEAAPEVVDAYLEEKVRANARDVLSFARVMVEEEYTINGEAHRLDDWDCLLDMDWLRAQLRSRESAVIHGDLTIENIIVCPERPRGWYLIDPNPQNVLDSPLIDWAKLMQSLNLGYEGLNRGGTATVHGGAIHLALTRSHAYAQLDACLGELLRGRLGPDRMREVAFHEIVNYLRLTPYKIRRAPQKGLAFFACAAILLRRYRETADA